MQTINKKSKWNKKLLKTQLKQHNYNLNFNEINKYQEAKKNLLNIIDIKFKYKKTFSKISTKSNTGNDGKWLIDPFDITIGSGSDANVNGSLTSTGDDAFIDVWTLQTALSSSNVTVQTGGGGSQQGNITVQNSIFEHLRQSGGSRLSHGSGGSNCAPDPP